MDGDKPSPCPFLLIFFFGAIFCTERFSVWWFCWVVFFQGQCRPQVETIWNALHFTTSITVWLWTNRETPVSTQGLWQLRKREWNDGDVSPSHVCLDFYLYTLYTSPCPALFCQTIRNVSVLSSGSSILVWWYTAVRSRRQRGTVHVGRDICITKTKTFFKNNRHAPVIEVPAFYMSYRK